MDLKDQISISSNSVSLFSPWFVYITAVIFLSLQFFLQISFTVMVKALMHDFNVGEIGISSVSSTLFYGYIFWLIPAGLMLDYFGSKKSILFAYLILGMGCFIFGYSNNLFTAIIGRFMMGVGSAFAFINMLYVINLWFSSKSFTLMAGIGEAISIFTASISTILLPWGINHVGWRFIILASGYMSIFLFFSTFLFLKNNNIKETNVKKIVVVKSFLSLIKNKKLWLLGIYGLCVFSLITVFSSLWGVPFITNVYHYDIKNAATAVMMVPLGIGTGCLVIGFLSFNIFKNKDIMLIASLACGILISLIFYMPRINYYSLLLLLFFCGFFSATYIQAYAIARQTYSKTSYGSVMSIITIIIMGGAPLLQICIGALLHTKFFNIANNTVMNFRLSFLMIPLCLLIAFIIVLKQA